MKRLLDWFGHWADAVYTWGYVGVFVALVIEGLGLPFPGDAVMAFYGVAAANGRFHPVALISVSFAGYMTGTTIAYLLSIRFGSVWLNRIMAARWLNQRSMTRTTSLLDRYGPLLLVPGRFLPGVRSVSSYVAGALRMEFSAFLLYTSLGVVVWCSMWILIGFWFGEHLEAIMSVAQSSVAYITGGAVALLASLWVYRRTRTTR